MELVLDLSSKLRVSCGSVDPEIMAATARPLSGPARYKLSGVLYHHGEFTGSGHYTVDVLDSNKDGGSNDVWLHIDNETMNKVHLEDKFPEGYKTQARDQCSTLLFYDSFVFFDAAFYNGMAIQVRICGTTL
jgi:ubiquitin C-terminal hydrolase